MKEKIIIHYPQDERDSFLLPVTQGCSYNQCLFCTMYRDQVYEEVSFSQIEQHLKNADPYTEKVFLTGADPLAIGFEKMEALLAKIRQFLPICARVSSYSSVKNLSAYTLEQLAFLHDGGLRQLYIGFETGRDDLLRQMRKPHTLKEAIVQAQKLNRAHLPFNAILLLGLGGHAEGEKSGLATAAMMNQMEADRLITMKLTLFQGSKLAEMAEKGTLVPADHQEILREMEVLLEGLEPQRTMIFDTTHPTNVVKIKGVLPREQRALLKKLHLLKMQFL